MKKDVLMYGLLLLLIAFGVYQWMSRPKLAYVELDKVYSGFDLKKKLEKKLENVLQSRKTVIDSMEVQLKALSGLIGTMNEKDPVRRMKIEEFEYKKQAYFQKKKMFEEDNQRASQDYDQQVWKQLNQFVKDYGKQQAYDYLFGAEGSGSLMYAKDAHNITEEVTNYVNQRYSGEGK